MERRAEGDGQANWPFAPHDRPYSPAVRSPMPESGQPVWSIGDCPEKYRAGPYFSGCGAGVTGPEGVEASATSREAPCAVTVPPQPPAAKAGAAKTKRAARAKQDSKSLPMITLPPYSSRSAEAGRHGARLASWKSCYLKVPRSANLCGKNYHFACDRTTPSVSAPR